MLIGGKNSAVEAALPLFRAGARVNLGASLIDSGSLTAGKEISEAFIENGRYDGEKIFGDAEARARAGAAYARVRRPRGE